MSFFGYGATGHNSNSNSNSTGSASQRQSMGASSIESGPPRAQGEMRTDPVSGASTARAPSRPYLLNNRDTSTISADGLGEKSALQHLPYQTADDSHHDHEHGHEGSGKEGGGVGEIPGGLAQDGKSGHCFHHAAGEHCSLPHLMQPLVTPLNHDVVESVVIRVRDSADVTQKAVFYFWDEWKHFVNRGNVIDLGIGVVIGGAFSDIIDSFVVDILTPPLSLWATGTNLENSFIVLRHGKTPGKYATYKEAQADGAVTENTGHFLKSCLNFLVIAFFLFWIVKAVHNVRKEKIRPPPKEKTCNWCRESIALEAFRCKYCQSFVKDIPGIEDAGIGMFVTVKRPKQPLQPPVQSSTDQKHGDTDANAGTPVISSASVPQSSGTGTPAAATPSGQNLGKQAASGTDPAAVIE